VIGCHIYIALRSCWCNIIFLNVHAPTEEKHSDSKESFCEGLEQVFNHFPKYHMKILLEEIFKHTIGNESLQEDSNDGVC
jgi:hypothetical protein